ncbi:MAG: hypothetical protein IJV93_07125 [Lentisphaeria bacterium]|nr:hypothetical protein [Lentisphaeria bacterium]
MDVKCFFAPWLLMLAVTGGLCGAPLQPDQPPPTQTLRLVQDDAQDYMVSRIFTLKHIQSNDVVPFVEGMVKRYNMNSSVSCFSYAYGSVREQILSVTTPEKMMTHVAAFLEMADRAAGNVSPGNDVIRGTGISRGVYRPKYRSGQVLVDLIVNALVNAGPWSSLYGYDSNSNQIYWKDNASNSSYVYQFLSYIDRPPPHIRMAFSLYEIRESTLRDMGIDYLAWKNGPGLNLFQIGWQALDLSSSGTAALQSLSGPFGGFFFAPQFDASFIRILEQSGSAERHTGGELTVANSDTLSYELSFSASWQNIVKNDNDRTSVTAPQAASQANLCTVKIIKPIVCIDNGKETGFAIKPYSPGENADLPGILYFGYGIQNSGAVERNNFGTELIVSTTVSGNGTIPLNCETVLGSWENEREVEETIGIPWLSEIPYLKYLFSTTVKNKERSLFFLTVTAKIPDTAVTEQTTHLRRGFKK